MRHSRLELAAPVTIVTGSTAAGVLRAFGADPEQPGPLFGTGGQASDDPQVAALGSAAAVIAVEYNGFRGTDRAVLSRASAGGRAASMFWNINAMTNLSFAEDGKLLASFEPPVAGDVDVGPQVAAALDGLDFSGYCDKVAKGLAAVQRFTGGIIAQDLKRIEAAGIAFRIAPGQYPLGQYVRYFEGGMEVTAFEMRHPWQRHGPDPDRFVPHLRQAGLPVDPPDVIPDISDPGYAVLEMVTLEMLTAALGIKVSREVAEGPLLTAQRGPARA